MARSSLSSEETVMDDSLSSEAKLSNSRCSSIDLRGSYVDDAIAKRIASALCGNVRSLMKAIKFKHGIGSI